MNMNFFVFFKRNFAAMLFAASMLAMSQQVAASTIYALTDSNTEGAWPDGVAYAFVTLTQSGSNVTVSVDANDAAFTPPPLLSNYGIQAFAFNDLSGTLVLGDISALPGGWSANVPPSGNSDGFGLFDAQVDSTGTNRQDPLTFTVLNSTVADFADVSSNGSLFAVHITDIDGGTDSNGGPITSAWFGGGTVVPVPAAVWLFGSGLLGLVGVARRRRS